MAPIVSGGLVTPGIYVIRINVDTDSDSAEDSSVSPVSAGCILSKQAHDRFNRAVGVWASRAQLPPLFAGGRSASKPRSGRSNLT